MLKSEVFAKKTLLISNAKCVGCESLRCPLVVGQPERGAGAVGGGVLSLYPLVLSLEQRGLVLELFVVAHEVVDPSLQDLDPLVLHAEALGVSLVESALQLLHLPTRTQSHVHAETQVKRGWDNLYKQGNEQSKVFSAKIRTDIHSKHYGSQW